MTLFYRSYLIIYGLLLGAIAGLIFHLDQAGTSSLHWVFTALAAVAVAASSILAITGAFGKPATVERWADLLALPVYALLWCFSRWRKHRNPNHHHASEQNGALDPPIVSLPAFNASFR